MMVTMVYIAQNMEKPIIGCMSRSRITPHFVENMPGGLAWRFCLH
jgi:hypothetical protein